MKKSLPGMLFVLLFLLPCPGWTGDTGTYKIADYKARLTPHSDGNVTIEYYQKWSVTGGHIPWITVGVPNSNFVIRNGKGAVRELTNASGGGWAGVRVDLDRDYKPGESFEVWFSIEQPGLLYATGGDFKLDFIPGWYERAVIDRLTVTMNIAAKIGDVKASPPPTGIEGQEITWVRMNLGKGQQVKVSIAFPRKYMPGAKAAQSPHSGKTSNWFPTLIIAFFALAVLLQWIARRRGWRWAGGGYSGGSIFYGGLGGGGGSGRSSSGGGGFGGSSFSCACACVSCACACACAGGGGAGCSRKTTHACPLCRGRKEAAL